MCCLQYILTSPLMAGAWVNTPEQIKLFLTQQTRREEVEKSALSSPFRDIRNITENHAYIEYGWHPEITLTGNIVISDHQMGKNNQRTQWLEVGVRHKADWAKTNIIPLKFDFRHQHKNISKAASIKLGLVRDEGYDTRTGLNIALSQGEKIQISRFNYLELLLEINQELILWSSEDGFYRAHNKIILSKKGVSLNYHRLDSFGFGENSQSEHIDYFEFEFPAALLFGETLPKTTFVKIGRGENTRKGTQTSSGNSVYLQLKFDLIP
ncbi:MAG TPA: hypothetical protein DGQ22_07275 [Rhodobiaceae bacterium]|nr:hypothetical protein [Rhodobiaceae bacterium]